GTLGVVGVVTSPEPIRPYYKLLISGPALLCPGAIELGPSPVLAYTEVIVCSSDQNSLKPWFLRSQSFQQPNSKSFLFRIERYTCTQVRSICTDIKSLFVFILVSDIFI
ncbi:hypothetical protein Tco_0067836, partial [Tanacetum coccineum]